jgi:hypothetical protein
MQIHTTTTGGGPIGLRLNGGNLVNNGNLTAVTGKKRELPNEVVELWAYVDDVSRSVTNSARPK